MIKNDVFEREIKNIPFIDCIDKEIFLSEFLNAPIIPDFTLFVKDVISDEKLSRLEYDSYQNGSSEYDEFLNCHELNFAKQITNKTLLSEFYINNIKETNIYKNLHRINDVYCGFLKTISGNVTKGLFNIERVTTLKRVDFDRYKEPEIIANRILQILKSFDNTSRNKIINEIINDKSLVKDILLMTDANPENTQTILEIFNNFLLADQKEQIQITEIEIEEQPMNYINGIDKNLLKYLSENFTSTDKRFNDLTKYNQIYRLLNEGRDYNIEHRAYKNLIKELFNFDYLNREISRGTQKHLTQLENLAHYYNNSKK